LQRQHRSAATAARISSASSSATFASAASGARTRHVADDGPRLRSDRLVSAQPPHSQREAVPGLTDLSTRRSNAIDPVSQAYRKPFGFRVETEILPIKSDAKLRKTHAFYAIALQRSG